ncbi:MAG: Asp23/Gls24 family envelope stress response protein [Firmicutes bacterium]|nr:Asp23/Gls24 family envelope stress response protein [Bacillota bacterium]
MVLNNQWGSIFIAEEVVATIAGLATTECYGVVGMAPRTWSEGITDILGRDSLSKGVEVIWENERLRIEVHIVVGYGTRISEVARNIISQVKYRVTGCIEMPVDWVTVNVRSVKV